MKYMIYYYFQIYYVLSKVFDLLNLIFSYHGKNERSSELEIENPHLKNIDPKMVEMITNEIIECKNPITWDDISGLQFAKNTIQVSLILYFLFHSGGGL